MIILYATDTCPKCQVLKDMMNKKRIKYEECYDINEMIKKGFKEVPKLQIDGKVMNFLKALKWIKQQEEQV